MSETEAQTEPTASFENADDEVIYEGQVEGEGETWEVEKVLGKQKNLITGKFEYLLQWKNWDGEPTWEPEENCDCTTLIKQWEREEKRKSFKASSCTGRRRINRRSLDRSFKPKAKPSQTNDHTSSASQPATPNDKQLVPAQSCETERRRSTRVQELASRRVIDEITIDSDGIDSIDNMDIDDDDTSPNFMSFSQPSSSTPVRRRGRPAIPTSCKSLPEKPKAIDWRVSPNKTRTPQKNLSSSSSSDSDSPASSSSSSSSGSPAARPSIKASQRGTIEDDDVHYKKIKQRKLILEKIVGSMSDAQGNRNLNDVYFIVKWKGLKELEKIKFSILRKFYCQDIVEYFAGKIKFVQESDSSSDGPD